MPESYKYMSADEIADFVVDADKKGRIIFDMEKSFKIGRLTDGIDTFDVSALENLIGTSFYRLAQDFFRSLDDKSPEAIKFKEQVLFLTQFYRPEFYRKPNAATELTVFLERGINIISSVKMRVDFLRGMRKTVPDDGMEQKISRAIADSPFAEFTDIHVLLTTSYEGFSADEIKKYLDMLEKLATAEIISELQKSVPNTAQVNFIIKMVNITCSTLIKNIFDVYLSIKCDEIINKITLDNMLKLAKQSAPAKSVEQIQNPKDKEVDDLRSFVKILKTDVKNLEQERNKLLLEIEELHKQIWQLKTQDTEKQSALAKASAKMRAGIGSRGVRNMKKVVRNLNDNTK